MIIMSWWSNKEKFDEFDEFDECDPPYCAYCSGGSSFDQCKKCQEEHDREFHEGNDCKFEGMKRMQRGRRK